jgi:hypothetical protein
MYNNYIIFQHQNSLLCHMTYYITPVCVNSLGIVIVHMEPMFYIVYSCSVLSVVFSAEKCMDLFSCGKFFVMLILELYDLHTE